MEMAVLPFSFRPMANCSYCCGDIVTFRRKKDSELMRGLGSGIKNSKMPPKRKKTEISWMKRNKFIP